MPQGPAFGGQCGFEIRTQSAGAEGRQARDRVEVFEAGETPQVDRYHRRCARRRIDSTGYRSAATPGDERQTVTLGTCQQGLELRFSFRYRDGVG